MLTYKTTLPNAPPQSMPMPRMAGPYAGYGSTHQDMLNAQMGQAQADYDIARQKGETDYALKQQAAERQLVLQGLQQMGEAQQNQNALMNQRVGNVSGLLSGLFR
jgi:hypothetical protein